MYTHEWRVPTPHTQRNLRHNLLITSERINIRQLRPCKRLQRREQLFSSTQDFSRHLVPITMGRIFCPTQVESQVYSSQLVV
jgi:hypothetical protein